MPARLMLPASRRDRSERYEVVTPEGEVAGHLRAWSSSRGRKFFSATGIDPVTGKELDLGSAVDFEAQVARLERLWSNPAEFERQRHAGEYSGQPDDPNRIVHGPSGRGPKR